MDKSRRKKYEEYIRGPVWKIKRQQALTFYGRKCSVCNTKSSLTVHHVRYDRFGGKETMSDLRILCWPHHKELESFHYKVGKRKDGLMVYNMYKARYKAIQKRRKI